MAKINRENLSEHIIDYQLSMIDKSIYEALTNPKWREQWSITQEQYDDLKRYAVPLFKKVFKCNKTKAQENFEWLQTNFGLKTI